MRLIITIETGNRLFFELHLIIMIETGNRLFLVLRQIKTIETGNRLFFVLRLIIWMKHTEYNMPIVIVNRV